MLGFIKKIFGGNAKPQVVEKIAVSKKPEVIEPTRLTDEQPVFGANEKLGVVISNKAETLDCQNLNCPMPIVQIAGKIKTLNPGDELVVLATDPAFKADVEAWARKTGNLIVNFEEGATKKATLRKMA